MLVGTAGGSSLGFGFHVATSNFNSMRRKKISSTSTGRSRVLGREMFSFEGSKL